MGSGDNPDGPAKGDDGHGRGDAEPPAESKHRPDADQHDSPTAAPLEPVKSKASRIRATPAQRAARRRITKVASRNARQQRR